MDQYLCKHLTNCKSKICIFNHPERAICRDGNECSREDCRFNHLLISCRFGRNCTNPDCTFRHTFGSAFAISQLQSLNIHGATKRIDIQAALSTSSFSSKSTDSVSIRNNTAKPSQTQSVSSEMTPLELKAIKDHETLMGHASQDIVSLLFSDEFDVTDAKSKDTSEALKKRYEELDMQRKAYKKMRSRAISILDNAELNWQLQRELYRFKSRLPALATRPEIESIIEKNSSRFLIIQGQTGSGKSTQIAQYIADHPKFQGKKVICTQPRKIAAISLASRVSIEYSGGSQSSKPGYQIGYHVGGQKVGGKWCRIEFVTEGVMLERIMKKSPETFKDIGCIVVDEAHERSIICDILLGLFREDDPRWKDILIIVTSATIDLLEFSKFFKDAPTIEIAGKMFPVDIIYNPVPANHNLRDEVVKCALNIHKKCKQDAGDILCFLPRQEDVLAAKDAFESQVYRMNETGFLEAEVFALFGRQDPEQQAQVFEELPSTKRKIIFATDVAETSITIDGVVYVVDSGVKNEMVFDPKRNISSLRVNIISRSSAIQRAGRSGRTQPGQCYRLYSEEEFESMSINTAPEIFRRPLSLAILSLREMNIDPLTFGWISAPSKDAFASADEELRYLGAVDGFNRPTDLGKLITQSQHEPKLVRMIYRGCQDGFGMAALTIASVFTVSNMFFWNGTDAESKAQSKEHRVKISDADGDIVTMFRLFEEWLSIRDKKEATNTTATGQTNAANAAKKTNGKKEATDWCRNNFINAKAMGLISSTRSELLALFKFTQIWKQQDSQHKHPSNEQLKRLVFSGYFLHSARLIQSKNIRNSQYYAIHPDVLGNLDYRAAILNHRGKSSPAADISPPQWIIYDKILRLSSTLFPTTSPIDLSWIKDENEEFFQLCQRKCQNLPTEKIVKKASEECLKTIFGKYFSNLNSLEKELDCALDVDLKSGSLAAYCSLNIKNYVESSLDAKIADVLKTLRNQVTEEDYLGSTRVVIGQGYEVKDILFPQEYTTIYIRNLPTDISKDYLINLINDSLSDRKNAEIVRTIEITQHETNASVKVKFFSKVDAKTAFERLKGEMIKGQLIDVTPTGLGPKRNVTQGESFRLKISWALGKSLGVAVISFSSPTEANTCMDRIGYLFPGSRVLKVYGEPYDYTFETNKGKKSLPPTTKDLDYRHTMDVTGYPHRAQNIRFKTGLAQVLDFEYKITVTGLNRSIDEYAILARLNPVIPKWVKVNRDADPDGKSDLGNDGQLVEDRRLKLFPIQDFINDDTVTTDFFDEKLCRAGIFVYFNDKQSLQNAYSRSDDYSRLGHMFDQPHRLEVEYTHATSVHVDLHKFLQKGIQQIKNLAYNKGVITSEFFPKPNSKSKFVTLKFRSCNESLIQLFKTKLEELSKSTKFSCYKIELLFTWTGRIRLQELAKKTFLHWNNRTHEIWIYGNSQVQNEISQDLYGIVNYFKTLEVLEKPFLLNKKKIDLAKPKDSDEFKRFCNSFNLANYHFSGNKVFASGSAAYVNNFEQALDTKQFLFKKPTSKLAINNGLNCVVCGCPPEGNSILTSLCSHHHCLECIEHMFNVQPPIFPIKCQACETLFVINDILKCAPQNYFKTFLEVGVDRYQKNHAGEILTCPNPVCNQLFSYSARSRGKFGEDLYFCDECVTTYCMTCSQKVGKPIKNHKHSTCDEVQNGPSDKVSRHVKEIQEQIFNLFCPRCKTVFFEFDGCAAVKCESCGCGFCGICLKDCGQDAHLHVRSQCQMKSQTGVTGNLFISKIQLNQIHKQTRINKLKEYLQRVQELQVRNGILRAIRRDLIDLGIEQRDLGFYF